jgi:hypothetical protein
MTTHRLSIFLCVVNFGLLIFLLLSHGGPAVARDSTPILRGSALEIVDDGGRVRAAIKVQPAGTHEPTGEEYPETVIIRLMDAEGRPEAKIVSTGEGGAISLVGATDSTRVVLAAEKKATSLSLENDDGRQQRIAP